MGRKLKFHEKKLLKKVIFLEWKREGGHRENLIMQRYHITGLDDYKKYSGLCHMVQKLVNILKQMDQKDPFRIDMTDKLLEKLYNMGVIPTRQSIMLCKRLTVSLIGKVIGHRLSTVLVRLKFAEHSKEAVTYIEQGHIRVGPETVTDPAFLVTLVCWISFSNIHR
ncbi:hypothetical protein AAZX31_16G054400 [Glycine max]